MGFFSEWSLHVSLSTPQACEVNWRLYVQFKSVETFLLCFFQRRRKKGQNKEKTEAKKKKSVQLSIGESQRSENLCFEIGHKLQLKLLYSLTVLPANPTKDLNGQRWLFKGVALMNWVVWSAIGARSVWALRLVNNVSFPHNSSLPSTAQALLFFFLTASSLLQFIPPLIFFV